MLFSKKKKFYTLSDIKNQLVYTPLIFVFICALVATLSIIFFVEYKKNKEIELLVQKNHFEKSKVLQEYVNDIKFATSITFDEQEKILNKAVIQIQGFLKYSSSDIQLDYLIKLVEDDSKTDNLDFVVFNKNTLEIVHGKKTVKYLKEITDSKEMEWEYFKTNILKNIKFIGDSNLIYWIDKERRKIQLSFFEDIENTNWYIGAFSKVDDMRDATRVAILNTIVQRSQVSENNYFWFYDYINGYVYNYYNLNQKIELNKVPLTLENMISNIDYVHNFQKYGFLISLRSYKLSKKLEAKDYEYGSRTMIAIITVILVSLFLISFSIVFSRSISRIFNRYNKRLQTKSAMYKKWKDRYQLAIIASNDGLWDIDLKTKNIFFSKKWLDMFGYESSDILNLDQWKELIHPEDKEETFRKFQNHLEGKSNHFVCEYRIKNKKGKYKWILVRGKSFKESNRMLMMSMDIEERKKLSKEIKYLDLLVEYGRIVIFKWKNNSNLDIQYVSKSISSYGYSVDDFEKGKIKYFDFMHRDDVKSFKNDINKAILEDSKSFTKVHRVKDKNGQSKWIFFRTIFLKDDLGNITHLYGYINDITRMKLNEEELKLKVQNEVDKNIEKDRILVHQTKLAAMGEMLGNIAHQWRQPLNNINLLSHFLRDNYENFKQDDVNSIIKDIKVQIDYMSQTIDDFRNFYQPTKDKIKFDVLDAIHSCAIISRTQFEKNDIKLNAKGQNVEIYNYQNEFQQVVLNILNNASDAAIVKAEKQKFKAEVNISVKTLDNNVEIVISNNCGEAEEEVLCRMFEPYFTTKFENQGTGIGLYMAKTIIEKNMKGSIIAQNIKDGISFKIILPIINN